MNTLTVKIPEELERALDRAAVLRGVSRSRLVREAIAVHVAPIKAEAHSACALALAGDLVGRVRRSPRDLASDPRYMRGYGED